MTLTAAYNDVWQGEEVQDDTDSVSRYNADSVNTGFVFWTCYKLNPGVLVHSIWTGKTELRSSQSAVSTGTPSVVGFSNSGSCKHNTNPDLKIENDCRICCYCILLISTFVSSVAF